MEPALVSHKIQAVECPSCGTQNEDYKAKCFKCGQPLVVSETQETNKPFKLSTTQVVIGFLLLAFVSLGLMVLVLGIMNAASGLKRPVSRLFEGEDYRNYTNFEGAELYLKPSQESVVNYKESVINNNIEGTIFIENIEHIDPIVSLELWIDTKGFKIKGIYIDIEDGWLRIENIEPGEFVVKEEYAIYTPTNDLAFTRPHPIRRGDLEFLGKYSSGLGISVECSQLCFDGQNGTFLLAKFTFRYEGSVVPTFVRVEAFQTILDPGGKNIVRGSKLYDNPGRPRRINVRREW
jgi:hypothetical protein